MQPTPTDAAALGQRRNLIRTMSGNDSSAPLPLTLADALALPALRRTLPEVVAGQANLNRRVRWVHVLDVHPTDLLRGGELVLSTGAGPGADHASQRRFVQALSEEGACGLLIELGLSYRSKLPATLIEEAEAFGLPLIASHRPTRFVDITEAIHGALVDRRLSLLNRGEETGRRLLAVVLEGGGVPELLQETARAVCNPVLLENVASQLLAYAVHESPEEELLEAREEHRLARDRGGHSERGRISVEIRSHGRDWGRLTALDLDSPLSEEDRVSLEQAGVAIALRLLQEETDEQLRARVRGSFLTDLTHGRLREPDAVRRAAALGFGKHAGRLLPAALAWRSERYAEIADTPEGAWARLMPTLRTAIGIDRAALLGPDGDRLLMLCAHPEGEEDAGRLAALATALRAPLERRGLTSEDVTVAFGLPEREWASAGRRLARVGEAVAAARAAEPSLWHDARRSSVLDFLYAVRDSPELIGFVRDQLGALVDARGGRERELLRTLEAYLASNGSKAEAARLLHLERQSLYLRLERLERALSVDLDDPNTLLGLHLAVSALRMSERLEPRPRLRLTAAS